MSKSTQKIIPPKKPIPQDWHPADIKAALEKAGWSLQQLSLAHGSHCAWRYAIPGPKPKRSLPPPSAMPPIKSGPRATGRTAARKAVAANAASAATNANPQLPVQQPVAFSGKRNLSFHDRPKSRKWLSHWTENDSANERPKKVIEDYGIRSRLAENRRLPHPGRAVLPPPPLFFHPASAFQPEFTRPLLTE